MMKLTLHSFRKTAAALLLALVVVGGLTTGCAKDENADGAVPGSGGPQSATASQGTSGMSTEAQTQMRSAQQQDSARRAAQAPKSTP